MIELIVAVIIGYGLGNIQTSYLLAKYITKTDIREMGSGNAGASNAVLVLGWWAGLVTFIVDVGKAWIAMLAIAYLYPGNTDAAFLAGSMAVIGHIFPVILQFKGGKGIACILGLFFGTNISMGLILICIMGLALIISRYVVIASLISLILLPIFLFYQNYSSAVILMSMAISLVGIFKHRENIENLITGNETSLDAVLYKHKSD